MPVILALFMSNFTAHRKKVSTNGKLSKKHYSQAKQSGLTARNPTRGFRSSVQGKYEHSRKNRAAPSMLALLKSDSESSTSEENEEPLVFTQLPKVSAIFSAPNPSKQERRGKHKSKPLSSSKMRKGQTGAEDDKNETEGDSTDVPRKSRKSRYILFIGNLPYTASQEDVIAHFEKRGVGIKEMRLLTRKESGKSRGCCFAEFADSTNLQVS